jgi:tetratricopeptide (TPR) repeat protein
LGANRGDARREIERMVAAGELSDARAALTALELAEDDPLRLRLEAEIELRGGRLEEGRALVVRLLGRDASSMEGMEHLAIDLEREGPEPAFACLDAVVDAAWARGDRDAAVRLLERFTIQWPLHVSGLMKLVELCDDLGSADRAVLARARLADAYLAVGLGGKARMLAEDLVAREPDDPAHRARLRKALALAGDQQRHGSGPGAEHGPRGAPADESERDLTGMPDRVAGASRAAGTQPDPFDDFRIEIARDSSDEAGDQHFRLALTYRELGMIDEAMVALEMAAASARHRFEAAVLLGSLNREQKRSREAVKWMERAADAPAPTKEDARRLLYDLADTLEELGDRARALALFDQIQRDSGDYRDVRHRIARLAAGE